MAEVLHLYLPSPMREDAEAGKVNIINLIGNVVGRAGWRLAFHADTEAEREKAPNRSGYALFHMTEPFGARCLTLRRAYFYPFWQIEATAGRGRFDVARKSFEPGTVEPAQAKAFVRRWRPKLLGDRRITSENFVFMPLQGRLSEHRSFQAMSPLDMIAATLEALPRHRIVATLHPKESYSDADLVALDKLSQAHHRFRLASEAGEDLLSRCKYVVTQNSALALTGFFAEKPAVLFAEIDFHHIAGSVPKLGLAPAFDRLGAQSPDFAAYLFWFFRLNCINGGAPEAEGQILARLRAHDWPL
jgi:hypothetical protein